MAVGSCVNCGKLLGPGKSKLHLCYECSTEIIRENARQLKAKKGPYYEKWKAGVKAHAKDLE